MVTHHIPSDKLRLNYPVVLRWSGLTSVLVLTLLLLLIPRLEIKTVSMDTIINMDMEQIEIPQTEQLELPPPPARPTVPIESENMDIPDDLTIDETTFDGYNVLDMNPPPPPGSGPKVKFVPYDEPPHPIGGYSAIRRNVVYPELAREAGVEGTVIVQANVDIRGRVRDMVVLTGVPNSGLNEAAMDAVRKTRFTPAMQRDKPVAVWISIPVKFLLDS